MCVGTREGSPAYPAVSPSRLTQAGTAGVTVPLRLETMPAAKQQPRLPLARTLQSAIVSAEQLPGPPAPIEQSHTPPSHIPTPLGRFRLRASATTALSRSA